MAVFNQFHSLSGANFAKINSAFVTLLPKKDGAESVGDFRPISLINSIAKLITKVLSLILDEKI
uniref:Reverse transcriptase domain-containing protein n=1 Tax=Aegilops tauschii subsp. strangulata TaxID=200361 RepID=A0A453N7T1_AEGTS